MDEDGVTFRWKDYRDKGDPDRPRHKTMTLTFEEFMRRFLLHVLPGGFHRIRHFGLLANNGRQDKIELARQLLNAPLAVTATPTDQAPADSVRPTYVCSRCGAAMVIIETLVRAQAIRAPPPTQVVR
jgi:hypothetical protein